MSQGPRIKVAGLGLVVSTILLVTSTVATASPNVSLFLDGSAVTGGFQAGYTNVMASDSQGNLYVVGSSNGTGEIVQTPIDGSSAPTVYATAANFNGATPETMANFNGATPETIAIDSSDNIFVYASDNEIYEFTSGQAANTNAVDYASLPSPGAATTLAVVGTNLYAARYDTGTIYTVSTSLSSGLPATNLSTFATGLAAPGVQGMTASGNNLLVADDNYPASGIYNLDTTAGPYTSPPVWVDMSNDPSNAPVDIAVDSSGNVFIVDYGNRIFVVPAESTTYTTYLNPVTDTGNGGTQGPVWVDMSNDPSNAPVDIAVDSSGNVFIADYGNRIFVVPAESTTYTTYLNPVTDTGNGGTQGLSIVGSQIFLAATDSATASVESIFQLTTYDGSTTPSTTLPPDTTTSGPVPTTIDSRTLAHTGFSSGTLLVASALFVTSGLFLMGEVSRARRRAR